MTDKDLANRLLIILQPWGNKAPGDDDGSRLK